MKNEVIYDELLVRCSTIEGGGEQRTGNSHERHG